jgi:anti-sigma-K factor RskA
MSDIEIHHLGAAYALDALDTRERQAFEAHFVDCDLCRTEVREFREAASELGRLTTTPPSPEVRDRVLAEIAVTRQLPPRVPAVARLTDRRRPRPVMAGLAAAAAVACFVVGAVVAGGVRQDGFDSELAALVAEPGARLVQLDGEAPGTITVAWSADRVAVVGAGLPDADPGRAYELWAIGADGTPHPMRLLEPARDGAMQAVIDRADLPGEAVAWGVTIEPAGGSEMPTTPVLYAADVTT